MFQRSRHWLDQEILSSLISGGHFSFLATTVNQQASHPPELEVQIITKVAGYGQQLGRPIQPVDQLARHSKDPAIKCDDRRALDDLAELANDITTARERLAQDHLDQILTLGPSCNCGRSGPPVEHREAGRFASRRRVPGNFPDRHCRVPAP